MTPASSEPSTGKRHHVVIVGSGFGGLNAARKLKRADVDITLISKTTTHLFQPLLYQVATGILSEGDIAPTTRLILRKQKNVRVLLGEVNAIDLKAQTVTSKLMDMETVTEYDSLIVASGSQQSYFGNDEFATFAPGMKTIDDALELRGRILGAFEAAEVSTDPAERERRLTFVAERTLAGAFRTITPSECRVVLVDAAPLVLPPMGEKLGGKAQRRLEKMDVEVQLNAMVTAVDYQGIAIKEKESGERRIECACKVWAAGVQASKLGEMVAKQSDGTETDRAGRVVVEPDLTVKGHPHVFVIGDLAMVPDVPGMAQGAIQGAKYATKIIKNTVKGKDDPATREPFKYFNKGSMATISRFSAVAQVGKVEFGGFIAWLAWLVLHLAYLVGHRNRIAAMFSWLISFLGRTRGQMAITSQMIYGRVVTKWMEESQGLAPAESQGALATAEQAEKAEKAAG
jgi:NADH dehydrogenase